MRYVWNMKNKIWNMRYVWNMKYENEIWNMSVFSIHDIWLVTTHLKIQSYLLLRTRVMENIL